MRIITFLVLILLESACHGLNKNELPKKAEDSGLTTNAIDPHFGEFRCSLKDRQDNLWFGTMQNGLYKYDGKSFAQFTMKDGLDCNTIYCILEDRDGKIWIGTELGLCLYDGKSIAKIRIPIPKNLPPNKNPLYQSHWVYSMIQDKNGKLWFATIDGVYTYDGTSFTHFAIDEAPHGFLNENDKVERVLEDKEGNIWFGGRTNEGVFRYDGKSITNIKLKDLVQRENGPNPRSHNWGWPQIHDKKGNIWFSNWGGVYLLKGGSIVSFSTKDGLVSAMNAKIIEAKNGNIWVCGDGIFRYDGSSITRYIAKDKSTRLGGWSILEDKMGNLWVGTKDKGLYIFNGVDFITYAEFMK